MRQRKKGRVLGPYRDRKGWRVIAVGRDGARDARVVASEGEAEDLIVELERQLALNEVTVTQAIEAYAEHLRADKGRRESSVVRCVRHLEAMMPDGDLVLADVTREVAAGLYQSYRTRPSRLKKPYAVDTHRNALAECGTFGRWTRKKGWVDCNPFEDVEPMGKRKRGKLQLRQDEARKLFDTALPAALDGDRGALVTVLILLEGTRATESMEIGGRNVDDGGRLIWIEDAKTEAGIRRLEVPDVLAGTLAELAKAGRVFPEMHRTWVNRAVRRWCGKAGVTLVSPHGLRGTHSTLAREHGATSRVVADALGHTQAGGHVTTERHYIAPGTVERETARRTWKVIAGGRS
jgi:integrase